MKYFAIGALLFSVVLQNTFAQDKAKIKAAATQTTNAIIKGDYAAVADHSYPKLLAEVGGKQAFIKTMNQAMDMMKKQGIVIEKVTVGDPGEIYPVGKDILCVVPETITVKMQSRYLTTTTPMVAVSSDKGKTWYFVDTSSSSPQKLKELFPAYNGKPSIPRPTNPIFSDKAP